MHLLNLYHQALLSAERKKFRYETDLEVVTYFGSLRHSTILPCSESVTLHIVKSPKEKVEIFMNKELIYEKQENTQLKFYDVLNSLNNMICGLEDENGNRAKKSDLTWL